MKAWGENPPSAYVEGFEFPGANKLNLIGLFAKTAMNPYLHVHLQIQV